MASRFPDRGESVRGSGAILSAAQTAASDATEPHGLIYGHWFRRGPAHAVDSWSAPQQSEPAGEASTTGAIETALAVPVWDRRVD